MAILLGVDTGGTFTDAVIWDDETARLCGKAKSLTTHTDPGLGIAAAARAALAAAKMEPGRISLISLSTTLATNALVEGYGEPAGLVLTGFLEADLERGGLGAALGADPVIFTAGGHRSDGSEAAPFDEEALRRGLSEHAGAVSGFAVASLFAVRNAAHERRAAEIILEETGLPVTASHQLSAKLGGPKRALTTLLNARLVGMIRRMISGARARLAALGVDAPVMIVRGDGALMSAAEAEARPIETILSGPAASLVGAAHLTGAKRAIISDIGGTTTDIAILENGRPRTDPAGASVGGWRTMVEAVAMRTHGLGGDSEVSLDETALRPRILLGPRRAVPVSLLAHDHPEIHDILDAELARPRADANDGRFLIPGARPGSPSGEEAELLAQIGAFSPAGKFTATPRERRLLNRLLAGGWLRRAGFTPTDAAHVLGQHSAWDSAAAQKAAALFARRKGNDGKALAPSAPAFAEMVIGALTRRSAELTLEAALGEDGVDGENLASSVLGAAALDGRRGFAAPSLTLTAPLIGLGASAHVYYPAIAKLAGAEALIPADADVANAIGAVAGLVEGRAEALILPGENGRFDVIADGAPRTVFSEAEAKALAAREASSVALARAKAAGAAEAEVSLSWEEKRAEIEGRDELIEARVIALAGGRPGTG